MFAAVLAVLALAPALLSAHPTGRGSPVELAPRSFQSASTTCYYQCPDMADLTPIAGSAVTGLESASAGTCTYSVTYQLSSYNAECIYNADTGVYISTSGYIRACPQDTLSYECDAAGADAGFKRSYIPRQLTEKEKLIQARQYKPRKVVSSK